MIYSSANKPKRVYEKNSGKRMVETAGYIPFHRRIADMIQAGERLVAGRAGYDTDQADVDDLVPDPTRKVGYDMADASMALNALAQKNKASKVVKPSPAPKGVEGGLPISASLDKANRQVTENIELGKK